MTAREVLLASGGYTTEATPALRKKIIPIGSYIIVTEVLDESLARELSPKNRMIYDSKHFLYYYRLTPDRRMLFGGRAAFFPESENTVRESAEILRRGMIQVYPQLRNVNVEFVWGGTLDFAIDLMPHVGRSDGMEPFSGICWTRRCDRNLPGYKKLPTSFAASRMTFHLTGMSVSHAPTRVCAAATPWHLRWRVPITSFWIGEVASCFRACRARIFLLQPNR